MEPIRVLRTDGRVTRVPVAQDVPTTPDAARRACGLHQWLSKITCGVSRRWPRKIS